MNEKGWLIPHIQYFCCWWPRGMRSQDIRRDGINLVIPESWLRHQMETFAALLAFCAGNSPVPGEFPTQRPVTRSFDVFFDQCLNKRLSKQWWGWWFDTLSRPLWRHRNDISVIQLEFKTKWQVYQSNVFYHNSPDHLIVYWKWMFIQKVRTKMKQIYKWGMISERKSDVLLLKLFT